jgi:ATP-binding cassette, subfamily B (MDR/TAP), member 1
LTADVNQIELGIGEKSGLIFQGSSMIIASFAIALSKNWKLTLACMTAVPWTIVVTGTLASIDTRVETKIKSIYSRSSTLVEEAQSSIANVTALGAANQIVNQFREKYINQAMKMVWIRGTLWAIIVGNMFFCTYAVYGLCLFYGVKLVIAGDVHDGGTVLM